MSRTPRRIFDIDGHLHFVTFSCYHRLPLLSRDRCKQIVLGHLNLWSGRDGVGVVGYVVMPNHVHALLRPISSGRISIFMQHWKQESSSAIAKFLGLGTDHDTTPFGERVRDASGTLRVWQSRSYCFNVFSLKKVTEKLQYMHNNPVRKGLVEDSCDWPWSSAAFYLQRDKSPIRLVPYDGPFPEWLACR